MPYTNINGHPCIRDDSPEGQGHLRCIREDSSASLEITRCSPGLPVHLPENDEHYATARRFWLKEGFHIEPPQAGHQHYTACLECWDEASDPVMHLSSVRVGKDDLVPGPAAGPGRYINWREDAYVPAQVLWVVDWPPVTHYQYTGGIPEGFWARQVVTVYGSHWYSHAPGRRYHDEITDAYTAGEGISFEHDGTEPDFVTGHYHRGPHSASRQH